MMGKRSENSGEKGKRESFTCFPNRILEDQGLLSDAEKILALKILTYAWERGGRVCKALQQTLADDLGWSIAKVKRVAAKLVEDGVITKQRTRFGVEYRPTALLLVGDRTADPDSSSVSDLNDASSDADSSSMSDGSLTHERSDSSPVSDQIAHQRAIQEETDDKKQTKKKQTKETPTATRAHAREAEEVKRRLERFVDAKLEHGLGKSEYREADLRKEDWLEAFEGLSSISDEEFEAALASALSPVRLKDHGWRRRLEGKGSAQAFVSEAKAPERSRGYATSAEQIARVFGPDSRLYKRREKEEQHA